MSWEVKIPLRDGVRLNATLYRPRHQRAPAPCVLMPTPYISDTHHVRGVYFASRGLPFVIVDVRGRGNSEGVFAPSVREGSDGYDVVEWLARQHYCDGKVGMIGGSYLGYCQWATAKELPPHLSTIVPTAAPYRGVDSPMRNNIFAADRVQWLALVAGRTAQTQISADRAFWLAAYRDWYASGRSFRDLDQALGARSSIFQDWLNHPEPDAYWDACNPTAEQYARLELPVLTITGCYDDDQPGALEHYRQHMRYASAAARARHYLIIGPWDHQRTGWLPQTTFGGLELNAASAIDMPGLHFDWYAWTMRSGPKPEFLRKPVAYYVMGSEQWRYAETLDGVTSRHEPFFLDSGGTANDVFGSGRLSAAAGIEGPDSYTYDPRDLQGAEIDAQLQTSVDSLVDQRITFALHGRALIYHSAPFAADVEITGFFRLRAWISIDCPDTDLHVSVHEIGLDGSAVRLSTDAIRARYRKGLRSPELIRTRAPLPYEFERFTFISREIRRGHRLRLVIAPLGRLVETVFSQKNYNGGGVVADESVDDARPVTVTLFHDESHPSVLFVPIGQPG
jgi:uncharacterized protein